jgi:hypothetical protein
MQLSSSSRLPPIATIAFNCACTRPHEQKLGFYPAVFFGLRSSSLRLAFSSGLRDSIASVPPRIPSISCACAVGKQWDEFLDEQNRAAFVSEREDLPVELAKCFEAFYAA